MANVTMPLGSRAQVDNVTITDVNGKTVDPSLCTITYTVTDPNGALTPQLPNGQFAPHAVGQATVVANVQYTTQAGGGPVVSSQSDTVNVTQPAIATVTTNWAPAP